MTKQKPDDGKEIDGWVYEWTCDACGIDLTIGVHNRNISPCQTSVLTIDICPHCRTEADEAQITMRVIYNDALKEVWKHVKNNNKVAAIKALRQHRVQHSDGVNSGLKECKEEVEHMTDLHHNWR
jgi:hypothetical protein